MAGFKIRVKVYVSAAQELQHDTGASWETTRLSPLIFSGGLFRLNTSPTRRLWISAWCVSM